jgi:hypothetical protein
MVAPPLVAGDVWRFSVSVEEKPLMATWANGKPLFSWKKRGSACPTPLYKSLIHHIAQHFIARDKDAAYAPARKEYEYLARSFARYLGDIYINVDEAHWRAIDQQIKWLFTKQDLSQTGASHRTCVQLHFIGKNLLEELLK